jgi:hypothetical protein
MRCSRSASAKSSDPTEAKRLAEKLEIQYTKNHGSWLNMAEIELSVLCEQCLDRCLPDQATLRREAVAREQERNAKESKIDWRFTTEDARIKDKSGFLPGHLGTLVP